MVTRVINELNDIERNIFKMNAEIIEICKAIEVKGMVVVSKNQALKKRMGESREIGTGPSSEEKRGGSPFEEKRRGSEVKRGGPRGKGKGKKDKGKRRN